MFGGYPAFGINTFATNPDLRPERTNSSELGIDARFAKGRFGMDLAVYDMTTEDQIISTYLWPLLLVVQADLRTVVPSVTEVLNFSCLVISLKTISLPGIHESTLVRIAAVVTKLPAGVSGGYPIVASMFPNDGGTVGLEYVAVEGELLGQLKGLTFMRDADNNIIHQDGFTNGK